MVLTPLLNVLHLFFGAHLLGEKLVEGEGHPVLVQACVRHNSEIDGTLVFFDNRVGMTRALIFVNLLEVKVNLDQVLAHVEL